MRRSKEFFDRELFYQYIEREDWYYLWVFIDDSKSVNITEEDLRIAFSVMPEQYTFRNLDNWGNRFDINFLREFRDRFTWRIFACARPHYKNSKLIEEFLQYFPDQADDFLGCNEFTEVLRYKHDLKFIKRFINRLHYARIFNWWGQRQKFHLPDEEIQYLKDHVEETIWKHT